MLVFGASLYGGNVPETPTAIGAAYDPTSDSWRKLPDSDLSPNGSTAAWNGAEMIAWDYLNKTSAYDPRTDSWRSLPPVHPDADECGPSSVTVEGTVFGNKCGLMAIFGRVEGRWRDISRPKWAGWGFTLVAADPAVILLGRNVDTEEEVAFAFRPGRG